MIRSLAIALLCLLPLSSLARDVFVDSRSGNDRAKGIEPQGDETMAGPVRTISKALRLASIGDRIVLAEGSGPYYETLSLSGEHLSGITNFPLIIEGSGCILEGAAPVPQDAWERIGTDLFAFQPARLGHAQLFIAGRPAVRRPATSLDFTLPELNDNEWCFAGGRINMRVEPDKIPQNYDLTYSFLPVGITLYQVHDVQIRNLTIQGFQLDGVNAHDTAREVVLRGLTCRGNGRSGISVGGASRVGIDSCLVGDNGEAQLRTEGYSITRVDETQLLGNTAPAFVRDGGRLFIDEEEVFADRAEPMEEAPAEPKADEATPEAVPAEAAPATP